jgi:hypothetical protein
MLCEFVDTGLSEPVDCPAGYYCPAGTTSVPNTKYACEAGTYNPYENRASQSECVDCPAGMYCSYDADNGKAAPDGQCSAGYYCPAGSAATAEPVGTHSMGGDAAGECPAGHYCPVGTPAPLPCEPGTYQANTG